MTVILSKQEFNGMRNHIIDKETGMTEFDLFEARHPYEDIKIM